MHRPTRIASAVAALGAVAALALTACSSDSEDTPAQASDPAAASLLSQAADSTEALTGAHVTLSADGKFQGMNATEVVADVNTDPVAGTGTVTLNMGSETTEAPFVYVDGKLYANVDEKGWIDYGDGRSIYDVSKILDKEHGVPAVLRAIEGAEEDGTEQIDGVSTTKVTGTVPASKVAALTGSTGKAAVESTESLDTTVWVTDDGQVARVEVNPAPETSVIINISKWNETVDVEKPAKIESPKATPSTSVPADQPTREPVK